jgi:hypothetical protein
VFLSVIPGVVVAGVVAGIPIARLRAALAPVPDEGIEPVPVWAAAMLALGAAALQLAGQRLDLWSVGLLVGAVVLLVVSFPRVMPARSTARPGLWTVIAVRGLAAGAFFGAEAFTPLMLIETRGLELLWAGAALTIGSLGWTFGSWLQARPWVALRRDQLLQIGALALVLGVGLVAVSAVFPALSLVVPAIAWVIAGFGMGLVVPVTTLATIHLSVEAEQGRNQSSLQVSEALGNSVFSGVAGTVFASLYGMVAVSLTFGAVLGTMAVVGVALVLTSLRLVPLRNEASSRVGA